MNRRDFLTSAVTLAAGSVLFGLRAQSQNNAQAQAAQSPQTNKPSIIIILADDLGYADLGCQGCSDIPTPHVDSLAANGVRFTNGYANHCVCAPSRAGLMSGRYQHRFGFEYNSGPAANAADNFGLPPDETTLPERLKSLGYATGMVGKWHLGYKEGLRPHERGFDYHFGFIGGSRPYWPDATGCDPLVRNGQPVTDEKEYLTDAFAREAVDFIERSKEAPFFLYLAFNAVHNPLQTPETYEKRFPNIADPKRRTYAGMLTAMDDAVGRVLSKLRERELDENTLICFYSDNGGPTPQTTSRNDPLRGYKGQVLEGGIRVPFLMQWKGRVPPAQVYSPMVMAFDVHATALAAAGGAMPTDKPLDGVDLIPYLTGKKEATPHERLFWRAGDQHALRSGDWKLVQLKELSPQLFNLKDDISESHDLSADAPDKLRELQTAYDAWNNDMIAPRWLQQAKSKKKPQKERAKRNGNTPARSEKQ